MVINPFELKTTSQQCYMQIFPYGSLVLVLRFHFGINLSEIISDEMTRSNLDLATTGLKLVLLLGSQLYSDLMRS